MRDRLLTLVFMLLALTAPQDTSAAPPAVPCQVDPKFVELGFEAFDQDDRAAGGRWWIGAALPRRPT